MVTRRGSEGADGHPRNARAESPLTSPRIQQELDRILASAVFQRVERLRRFISFIVAETLAGRGAQLKEYVVGTAVFGKDASFDPRNDPIVRVQARRLRARLDDYFRSEGAGDEVVVELPKGGYVPSFRLRDALRPEGAGGEESALSPSNTLAVARFADRGIPPALRPLREALRDELVHRLTAVPGLKVMARDPSQAAEDPIDGARALGASAVLMGALSAGPRDVRVAVQLAEVASGCYRWSESMGFARGEAADLPGRVADLVTSHLAPRAEEAVTGSAPALRSAENPAAYNLYRQARYHLDQRSEESLLKAADFFKKALAEDPQYALAHSGLSDAYGLLTHYGVLPPAEAAAQAAESAAAAVMLDGASVEARTSLAHVKATEAWDWRGSEQEFQRAIALDPRHATTRHWYAMSCLVPMGRLDEALEQIQLAQSLDPVSAIISRDHALVLFYRREFDAALDQCDHTIELNAHFSAGYWALGLVQEQRGDLEEAVAALQRAVKLSPRSPKMNAALGRALAASGQSRAARGMLKTLRALARERYVSPLEFALIFFSLNEPSEGFAWLEKAARDRSFDLTAANVDPRFDSIRADRRFRRLTVAIERTAPPRAAGSGR